MWWGAWRVCSSSRRGSLRICFCMEAGPRGSRRVRLRAVLFSVNSPTPPAPMGGIRAYQPILEKMICRPLQLSARRQNCAFGLTLGTLDWASALQHFPVASELRMLSNVGSWTFPTDLSAAARDYQ